jgi:hypothetical protein
MLLAATNMYAIPIWLLGCFVFTLFIIGVVKILRKGRK